MTPHQVPTYTLFVGIDIAATSATVSWKTHDQPPSRATTIAQTPAGFVQLQAQLATLADSPATTLGVLEATGSYWMNMATILHAAGYQVSVINPAQAHAFAKALLKRVKTDPIDAQTLAQLAALLQPAPWSPPPAVYHELMQRLAQRDDLLTIRQQLKNQRHALDQQPVVVASVRERLDSLIATLTDELRALEREIAPALAHDTAWDQAAAHLQPIKGVGLLTASWILVTTLNFTLCPSAEAASAYAGLAPNAPSSGTSVMKRPRIGHLGNRRLRTALYLATLSGTQHNPVLKAFYERLRAAGKPVKVARCAVARKLLGIAWAVVTKHQDCDPQFHQPNRMRAT